MVNEKSIFQAYKIVLIIYMKGKLCYNTNEEYLCGLTTIAVASVVGRKGEYYDVVSQRKCAYR